MMRGLFTPITYIRRQVFLEVAKVAWEERDPSEVDDIPYRVIDGEVAKYRGSVFHERAIVAARTKYALGLDRVEGDEDARLSKSISNAISTKSVIKKPLIHVIPFACVACETSKHEVTNNCRKCMAHPCMVVCPVNAITIGKDQAEIDKEKCIDCGRCATVCPYTAIVKLSRPCQDACGADAIESDELGRAKINHDKCVNCGMCIVNCPFAAITDKSDIFQLILAIKSGQMMHAIIAPSFVGQFGPLGTPGKLIAALKELGFHEVVEVALGADIATKKEAEEFFEIVPDKQPFLGTSCCPSWRLTVEKFFPELQEFVSLSSTPMVETAKEVRKRSQDGKIVFIGPCVAKKIEAMEDDVTPYVDFVVTFEELAAMFVAANIDISEMEEDDDLQDASKPGRNFAYATGVASAVQSSIYEKHDMMIPTFNANGVKECRSMLKKAKKGDFDGYLLEGMGCPDGCVGGAGTLLPLARATREVKKYADSSKYPTIYDNPKI